MKNQTGKWLLALVAACCLVPSALAAEQGTLRKDFSQNFQVPEGGTAAVYLVGAGLTCFGAMFLRSKMARPPQE